MGIGSMNGIKGMNEIEGMSRRPMGGAQPADSVIKNIQEEISEAQRQRQEISSREDLPVAEKVKKRQELQQKISGLNRELRQRQTQIRSQQQREALANGTKTKAAGRTDVQNGKARSTDSSTENVNGKTAQDSASQLQDFEIPKKEWVAVVESDSSREQKRRQEAVIARIEGGIAILKSEIRLDEARGADVEKKQEELKKQNEKLQKASAAQLSSPERLNPASEKPAQAKTDAPANLSKENGQAAQQPLFQDTAVFLTA